MSEWGVVYIPCKDCDYIDKPLGEEPCHSCDDNHSNFTVNGMLLGEEE